MNKKLYRCISSTDKVGIEFSKEIINIYFPLGYDISEFSKDSTSSNEKKSIIDLIKTISLCKNNGELYNYNYNYGKYSEIPVNSYLWILNDYIKNGLYNSKEKNYLNSQKGKTNWKRTFKQTPLFDNEEIVYLNPTIEVYTRTENIITEIHSLCVNISIDRIGWLFGNIKKNEGYKQTLPNNLYLSILNKELLHTFNDKKKTLLNHLIRIVSSMSDEDNLDCSNNLLVDNYYYAWERMVSDVFGNDNNNIKKYFPEIKWNLRFKGYRNPKMRPDTVIKKGDELYILDAKYYKYGVLTDGSLPGAEDVDKQITYGEYNNKKFTNVYNAFVMPYNKHNNEFSSDKNILDIGNVENNARNNDSVTYKKVAVILVDTKYLIDCYFKRENKNEIELIESIMTALEYKKN